MNFRLNNLPFHLENLKNSGKILMIKNGNCISIFKREMSLLKEDRKEYVETKLPKRLCKDVCQTIYENPGITTTELATNLAVHKSTISMHIKTLKKMDCLDVKVEGVRKYYYFKEEYHPDQLSFFEKVR